jgi:hypothetical protein
MSSGFDLPSPAGATPAKRKRSSQKIDHRRMGPQSKGHLRVPSGAKFQSRRDVFFYLSFDTQGIPNQATFVSLEG